MITPNIVTTEKASSDINEIIRGEISATEAYEQVMEKVTDFPERKRLKEFYSEHNKAVSFWRAQSQDEVPEKSSSVWGTVVEAFVGTSKILGEDVALKALKTGEEYGLSNYEKMLKSDELSAHHKLEIRNKFIPRQKRHIESLTALMKK